MTCRILEHAVDEAIRLCPEVRSVGIAIDYRGIGQDSAVERFVWMGRKPGALDPRLPESGAVTSPEAMVGSLLATLGLFTHQSRRLALSLSNLRGEAARLGQEIVAKHEELQKLKAEREALDAAAAARPGHSRRPAR